MEYQIKCEGCGKTVAFSNSVYSLEDVKKDLYDKGWVWMKYKDEHYCSSCTGKAFDSFIEYLKEVFDHIYFINEQDFLFDLMDIDFNKYMEKEED